MRKAVAGTALAVLLVAAPFGLGAFTLAILTLGLAYGLFAFGLDLAWGRAGMLSVGHAAFFGLGAYAVAIGQDHGWPPVVTLLPALVASVVLALLEWLPLMPADIAFAGRDGSADPVAALGDLLRPPTIWSPVEALAASGRDPASLERYAVERVTSLQISRLLRATSRIAAQLPLRGLPCESAIVASGCAAVEAGEAVCAEVAARQLVRYATSELIRRL